jgi:tight adherence protein C
MPIYIIIPIVLVVVVVLIIVFSIISSKRKDEKKVEEQLAAATQGVLTLEDLELQQPFAERVLKPLTSAFLTKLGNMGPKANHEKVKKMLQSAGMSEAISPVMFIGVRIGLAIGLLVLGSLFTFPSMEFGKALLYTSIATGLGYMLPGMWLGSKIKERQKDITKSLPDALDLLTISVEAGLGFDLALKRVTEKWDNELCREFKKVLQQVALGDARSESLRAMAERTEVEDVQIFTSAIIQAEQLGVSIAKILKLQSDQMRDRRRQRAEEQAQKAPVLMLFPMVFFIFPSIFVVILGPAVPKIMNSLGSSGI